jgi:hypothetical protein
MGPLMLLDGSGAKCGTAKATDLVDGSKVKCTYTYAPGNLGNLVGNMGRGFGGFGRRALGFWF